MERRPTTLLAELTHRCPLPCPYCSNPLDLARSQSELTTDDWKRVFTQARELGALQLGLSGGEPLIRRDLEELIAHAHTLGFYQTLVTSALGLTRERAVRIKDAGLEHVQISFQDSEKEIAEKIAGSFKEKFGGTPASSTAAVATAVVSKPVAKNTTSSVVARARSTAWLTL